MIRLLLSLLILSLMSCSSMIVRESDDGATTTGKVAGRTLLGIVTIGWSEVFMYDVKEDEDLEQYLEDYHDHVVGLANQGQITMFEAETLYQQERARATGALQADRAARYSAAGQVLQSGAASLQQAPTQPPAPQHCTSTMVYDTVYTNCY